MYNVLTGSAHEMLKQVKWNKDIVFDDSNTHIRVISKDGNTSLFACRTGTDYNRRTRQSEVKWKVDYNGSRKVPEYVRSKKDVVYLVNEIF